MKNIVNILIQIKFDESINYDNYDSEFSATTNNNNNNNNNNSNGYNSKLVNTSLWKVQVDIP